MPDTIFALSSGVGRAGVAVVRVSGPSSRRLAEQMCGKSLSPRRAVFSHIRDPATGDLIDHGLLLWFAGPASFTGEDVVEFHVHGGRAVVGALLDCLAGAGGLRAAEPGEFTRRAFENGKLDLTSVEGLSDLVAADTELQRRQALGQMSGALRDVVMSWRQRLIDSQALLEAHLDFPDESEIPVDITQEIECELHRLAADLKRALVRRHQTEIVRDGATVLLAGEPNSGKSSLLNRIAARDVAIISEVPGTTRDLLEITIDYKGLPITFIDSAGLRDDTSDVVEKIGISRTLAKSTQADIVLWLSPVNAMESAPRLSHSNLWVVKSKADLTGSVVGDWGVSAVTGAGVADLLEKVYNQLLADHLTSEPSLLVSLRQFQSVTDASVMISAAIDQLRLRRLELVAEELRTASSALGEMIGVIRVDHLLDEVFGRFCLGK